MLQWTWSALVRVMACRLFGAKPLPKTLLTYYKFHRWGKTFIRKFESKYETLHSWKCIWKCRLWNGGYFVQWRDAFFMKSTNLLMTRSDVTKWWGTFSVISVMVAGSTYHIQISLFYRNVNVIVLMRFHPVTTVCFSVNWFDNWLDWI